ncbi:sodium hydrogen exchanger 2, partial [Prunus dulcis]
VYNKVRAELGPTYSDGSDSPATSTHKRTPSSFFSFAELAEIEWLHLDGFPFGLCFDETGVKSTTTDEAPINSITLFVVLLCFCIVIGHLLEKSRWMTESVTALLIGLCTGIVILLNTEWKSSRVLVFNEDIFFIYLLPPIIFNAGFQVKKKRFFQNFMTIMLLGAVGSFISFVIVWLGSLHLFEKMDIGFLEMNDYLALGAIFSATDTVCTLQVLNQDETPLLYSLVFGEGVVNDATSVVLFNAIQRFDLSHINSTIVMEFIGNFLYLFLTSTLLGSCESLCTSSFSHGDFMVDLDRKRNRERWEFGQVGLLSAYIMKKLYLGRHSTDREVALMILMAYLSYMVAELFDLSGILTVFFCGIVMSHYTWHNVTERSRVTTKHAFATLSFVSEIFIFLYVGMDALDIEKWKFSWTSIGVSSILLGLVLIGRAAFVFPLCFASNLTRKHQSDKIGFKQQVTVWWAGLMRGAVSVALAYNWFTMSGHTQRRGNAVMITSTITVVLFTNVVVVATTKHSGSIMSSELLSSEMSLAMPLLTNGDDPKWDMAGDRIPRRTVLRMLLMTPVRSVHYYWRMFDDSFMRPVFLAVEDLCHSLLVHPTKILCTNRTWEQQIVE